MRFISTRGASPAVGLRDLLRARLEGVTSRSLEQASGLDLLQVAAAAHLTPRPGEAPPAPVQGEGGGFGGGGASGKF